jgi:hypothetical protein
MIQTSNCMLPANSGGPTEGNIMKAMTQALAFALVAGSTAMTSIAPSHAAIGNRAECYTAVTNACNKKKSDEAITACNNSGHSQCDKQFPKAEIDPQTPINFRATTTLKQGN